MKKCISALLCILCLSSLLILPVHAAPICFPDIDGDGKIASADARLILRNAVELTAFTDVQKKAADCNNDGIVSADDARSALRMAVGLDIDMLAQSRLIRSGYYACRGTITIASTSTDIEFIAAGDDFLLTAPVNVDDNDSTTVKHISYLHKQNTYYMLNSYDKIYYVPGDDDKFAIDYYEIQEMIRDFDLTYMLGSVSEKEEPFKTEKVTLDGQSVTCYSFDEGAPSPQKHYVDDCGNLILITDRCPGGNRNWSFAIDSVTYFDHDELLAVPENYIATDYLSFLIKAMPDNSTIIE